MHFNAGISGNWLIIENPTRWVALTRRQTKPQIEGSGLSLRPRLPDAFLVWNLIAVLYFLTNLTLIGAFRL